LVAALAGHDLQALSLGARVLDLETARRRFGFGVQGWRSPGCRSANIRNLSAAPNWD